MVKYKNIVVHLLTKIVIFYNIFGSIKAHQWLWLTSTNLYIWHLKQMSIQYRHYRQHTLLRISYKYS